MVDDDDNWQPRYPAHLIVWLWGVMRGTGFHYTPLEILETERRLPGLWADLGLADWQESLIEKQIETQKARRKGGQS